jgi:hypothetical protein
MPTLNCKHPTCEYSIAVEKCVKPNPYIEYNSHCSRTNIDPVPCKNNYRINKQRAEADACKYYAERIAIATNTKKQVINNISTRPKRGRPPKKSTSEDILNKKIKLRKKNTDSSNFTTANTSLSANSNYNSAKSVNTDYNSAKSVNTDYNSAKSANSNYNSAKSANTIFNSAKSANTIFSSAKSANTIFSSAKSNTNYNTTETSKSLPLTSYSISPKSSRYSSSSLTSKSLSPISSNPLSTEYSTVKSSSLTSKSLSPISSNPLSTEYSTVKSSSLTSKSLSPISSNPLSTKYITAKSSSLTSKSTAKSSSTSNSTVKLAPPNNSTVKLAPPNNNTIASYISSSTSNYYTRTPNKLASPNNIAVKSKKIVPTNKTIANSGRSSSAPSTSKSTIPNSNSHSSILFFSAPSTPSTSSSSAPSTSKSTIPNSNSSSSSSYPSAPSTSSSSSPSAPSTSSSSLTSYSISPKLGTTLSSDSTSPESSKYSTATMSKTISNSGKYYSAPSTSSTSKSTIPNSNRSSSSHLTSYSISPNLGRTISEDSTSPESSKYSTAATMSKSISNYITSNTDNSDDLKAKKIATLLLPIKLRVSSDINIRIKYYKIINKYIKTREKYSNNCFKVYKLDKHKKPIFRIGNRIILDKQIGTDSIYGAVYLSHYRHKTNKKFGDLLKFATKITDSDKRLNHTEYTILEDLTTAVIDNKCPHFPITFGKLVCTDDTVNSNYTSENADNSFYKGYTSSSKSNDKFKTASSKLHNQSNDEFESASSSLHNQDNSKFTTASTSSHFLKNFKFRYYKYIPPKIAELKHTMFVFSELANGDYNDFHKLYFNNDVYILNALAQIYLSFMFFYKYINAFHNDSHYGNFLYHIINPGGFFHYNIYGQDYYLENVGFLWVIWDFGLILPFQNSNLITNDKYGKYRGQYDSYNKPRGRITEDYNRILTVGFINKFNNGHISNNYIFSDNIYNIATNIRSILREYRGIFDVAILTELNTKLLTFMSNHINTFRTIKPDNIINSIPYNI